MFCVLLLFLYVKIGGGYWENIKKIQICYRFILQGRIVKP